MLIQKIRKHGAKYHETHFAPVGRGKNISIVMGSYDRQLDYVNQNPFAEGALVFSRPAGCPTTMKVKPSTFKNF